jgi:hypothetical protein
MEIKLTGLHMGKTWLSYIAAAHGVLRHSGMWEGDESELAGLTGMAFQFIVHETACPSSVTVYDWSTAHFFSMDRIGVYTDCLSIVNNPGMNTFGELEADSIKKIRESIDRGIGVVIWAPTPVLEFGIVTGYDDEESVFNVIDCTGENPDPLLYGNIGRSEVPFIYFQRFFSRGKTDMEKSYRDAFSAGLYVWKREHSDRRYGAGTKAYDNLINTLKHGDYNPYGLSYIINVYADTKKALALLFSGAHTSGLFKGLDDITERYAKISELFGRMAAVVPFKGQGTTSVDKNKIPGLIRDAGECRMLETDAMRQLGEVIGAA